MISRLIVGEAFRITGRGVVVTGEATGVIKPGDTLHMSGREYLVVGVENSWKRDRQFPTKTGVIVRGGQTTDFEKDQVWTVIPPRSS